MMKEYERWPSNEEYSAHLSNFQPFDVRGVFNGEEVDRLWTSLLQSLLSSAERVDVSCAPPQEDFRGNPSERQLVEMKIADFAGAFVCKSDGRAHWVLDMDDLSLYVSQCTVFSKESSSVQVNGVNVMDLLACTPLITDVDVDTINIWMNLCEAASTLHYDANHNFLCVLTGSKEVSLLSPAMTDKLAPFSAFVEAPNHSSLSVSEVDGLMQSQDMNKSDCCKIKVHAGDVIFIPEGWWHQVRSEELTGAINIWFGSDFSKSIAANQHMLAYFSRAIAHELSFPTSKPQQNLFISPFRDISSTENFAKTVENLTTIATDPEKLEENIENFLNCSFDCIKNMWLPFALEKPLCLVRLMKLFSPLNAHTFLRNWDFHEAHEKDASQIYRQILSSTEEFNETMNLVLQQRDRYIRSKYLKSLHSILGENCS